jgi:hypothetical protein
MSKFRVRFGEADSQAIIFRCTVVSGKDRFGKYVVEKQVEGGEEREVIYTSPAT